MYSVFYKLLPTKTNIADGDIHLLNELEIKSIKKTERLAIIYAAVIGGIMVIALYAPQYKYVSFFSPREFTIPLFQYKINISFTSFIYGNILVFVEVVFLTMLNIYCAHEIALSTGFIDKGNKSSKEKKEFLLNISHQKKNKEIHKLGIDPYLGLGKSAIFFMNLLFSLKATLSNYFVRIIFQRLLGRYAIRVVIDLLGIPVFAFWNAMATATVLKESRIIFMGVNYLKHFEIELSKFRALSEIEKSILYDTLQYISISKRDYHQNHYALSKIIIDKFSIATESVHLISKDYEINLKSCESDFKKLNEKILILGIVLDGNVSYREKNRIKKLNTSGVLTLEFSKIKEIANGFMYGKGIEI